ncbi:MAG TPA: DUF533 domain-containing protein [Polyangiaceae bacterium]|jgi:uncharacterized membrane protein YebE (DUF533 family)|nr:DUF533 domain-containing protein [Polyangiaceae bacterium]
MRRLTISAHACTETLRLLIAMAWADGRLDDNEKAGVRGAAEVLNLSKDFRDKLDESLAKALPLDQILFEGLSAKDKSFAYVAAVWMMNADENVDDKEKAMVDEIASTFGLADETKKELDAIAKDLSKSGKDRKWQDEIVALFKAIPPRLEKAQPGDVEVTFE